MPTALPAASFRVLAPSVVDGPMWHVSAREAAEMTRREGSAYKSCNKNLIYIGAPRNKSCARRLRFTGQGSTRSLEVHRVRATRSATRVAAHRDSACAAPGRNARSRLPSRGTRRHDNRVGTTTHEFGRAYQTGATCQTRGVLSTRGHAARDLHSGLKSLSTCTN